MPNFFPKWFNSLPLQILLFLIVMGGILTLAISYYFTPEYTRVGYQPDQPITFSHAIHVRELGMDCRHCHSFVSITATANLPTTQICMNCHGPGKIRGDDPSLELIRSSWKTGEPIPWVQVYRLPDYAYFNHAVHVNRGISCYNCHGMIDQMDVVYHAHSLSMYWCLNCHRSPENFLRPLSEVFNMSWHSSSPFEQYKLGMKLKKLWNINPPTTCGGCHR